MKVLAINGSPNEQGNTYQALQQITKILEKFQIETEILQIGRKNIHGCISCYSCSQTGKCVLADDIYNQWVEKLYAADGILIGSPVYYSGVAGTLKSFLDRAFFCSQGKMRHKIGSSLAVPRRSGGIPTFDQLNHYFLISEMIIAPSFYWNVIHGGKAGEIKEDAEGLSVLQNAGQNMAWLLQMKDQTKSTLPPPEPIKREWTNFIR